MAPPGRSRAILALTFGSVACGDSDEDDEGTATPSTQSSTSTSTAAGAEDVSAFCDAVIDADATFAAGGPTGPDPAQLQAAFDEAQSTAPAEIAGDVERLFALTEAAFASGAEEQGPPPPEVDELDANIDEYVLANCDFAEVDVTGTEYAFEDIPETVEAGQTAITFTNQGGEEHQLVLIRVNDGVTASVEELAQLQEEAFSMIEVKGFAMAAPGESDPGFVDLEPGRYGALCFFPVGSTPEVVAAAEEIGQEIEGPPHFTQGMVAEFTVE